MLLKITECCSAGCIHCLSDCKPDGKHMSKEMLSDVMNFIVHNDLCKAIIVSGGEPTEHPEFMNMMQIIINHSKSSGRIFGITITSNGFWVIDHQEEAKSLVAQSTSNCLVTWQISTDDRYYVKKLDTTKRIFREPGFTLCKDCVEHIQFMGRAKDNNLSGIRAKCSSCFNFRAVARQLNDKTPGGTTLPEVIGYMEDIGRFCTPEIRINGAICAGESDLCPPFSNIYKPINEIMKDLLACACRKCGNNDNLPDFHRRLINN